ncbi:hypothetical protein ISCGN_010489 [Ixodes scapularis]
MKRSRRTVRLPGSPYAMDGSVEPTGSATLFAHRATDCLSRVLLAVELENPRKQNARCAVDVENTKSRANPSRHVGNCRTFLNVSGENLGIPTRNEVLGEASFRRERFGELTTRDASPTSG